MDEKRAGYSLAAPGSVRSSPSLHLPARGSFPRVDDHLVVPELTRDEIIGGVRVVAMPAKWPHASKQTDLDFIVRAHVAPGYNAAADLLTRYDEESDFATDVCISKDGIDPETGARYLEEIAFEVVSEQNERLVTNKPGGCTAAASGGSSPSGSKVNGGSASGPPRARPGARWMPARGSKIPAW